MQSLKLEDSHLQLLTDLFLAGTGQLLYYTSCPLLVLSSLGSLRPVSAYQTALHFLFVSYDELELFLEHKDIAAVTVVVG